MYIPDLKDQLEYSYTNCVSHSYWVDDALINNSNWNSEGGGSGDVWIGGGSFRRFRLFIGHSGRKYIQERGRPRLAFMGNHRKHDSPNHGRLFGGDLYSQLKEKVKNNKINLEFDFGKGYS